MVWGMLAEVDFCHENMLFTFAFYFARARVIFECGNFLYDF